MRNHILSYTFLLLSLFWIACSDDDAPEPELVAGFENTSYALDLTQNQTTVVIEFSRETSVPTQVTMAVTENGGMTYGADQDYTTTPAISGNQLVLDAPQGATEVSFQLTKHRNPEFGETKSVRFDISEVSEGGLVGVNNSSNVEFAENPVSSGATMDATVGGEAQPNQVYIDLSRQTESAVARETWDLGFHNGADFRVILNSSAAMLARPLDKTDMNEVTDADTLGFGAQLDIDAIFGSLFGPAPPWLGEASGWSDHPDGDLTKTAIAEISESEADNPVYIVNRGKNPDDSQRGWLKIRILRNGEGYDVQYAEIGATEFETVTIAKTEGYNFEFLHFDDGMATVEPEQDSWDIAFTVITEQLTVGPNTSIPYVFKDYVIQNRNGVEVGQVMINGDVTFEGFNVDDLDGVTFSAAQNTIGSSWRTVASPTPGSVTGVVPDVFYVVKDPEDNYYKLQFTRMLDATTGERGFPQISYELL